MISQHLTYVRPDGSIEEIPVCHFQMNPRQQMAAMGCDFDENQQVPFAEMDNVEVQPMGKLSELNFILNAQMINSLVGEDWDFERYPNPEMILITDNRN